MPQQSPIELDEFDRQILRQVQADASISTQGLAERVGLSASPCWRRLKRMQEAGLITGQVAMVSPRALGLRAVAYLNITLVDHSEATIARFDAFVQRHDQVVECATITGSADYLLKVFAADPEALEQFIMRELLALGVVRSTNTALVLRQTKYTTALPV